MKHQTVAWLYASGIVLALLILRLKYPLEF